MNLLLIVDAIRSHRVRVTDHADEEANADRLTLDEVYSSVRRGEVIESYPSDTPYPSCLVFGMNHSKEPVHSVWAYNQVNGWAVLITVYRPDPARWIDWRQRKSNDGNI